MIKMICIFDSHNKVLTAWAKYRSPLLLSPPRLLTLDHHTDTARPFRNFIRSSNQSLSDREFDEIQNKYIEQIDFTDPNSIAVAVNTLSNDEHIIAAIKSNVISSAFVIAHNATNTNIDTYKEHKIVCRTVLNNDTVLESEKIRSDLMHFNKILKINNEDSLLNEPFILDIDLDYFSTFKSIEPKDISLFKELSKKAGLITIATEPEYVKTCAVDPGLTSEFLLKTILDILADSGHNES